MATKISYSHARQKLADLWDEVEDSRKAAVIQRRGHEDMALIPADELAYWVDTNGRTVLRLLDLMEAVLRDPHTRLGKPGLVAPPQGGGPFDVRGPTREPQFP